MPDMNVEGQEENKKLQELTQLKQMCEAAKQNPSVLGQMSQLIDQMIADEQNENEPSQPGQYKVKGSKPGFVEQLQSAIAKKQAGQVGG